jgi:hypothetical protein
MKFWWPHNATIIATLLAHELTGNPKYAAWHELVHNWAHAHFADPEFEFALVRYNADGSLDTTFADDGIVIAHHINSRARASALILQPDGKLLAAGRALLLWKGRLLWHFNDGSWMLWPIRLV